MKIKAGIAIVLFSTVALIGVMTFMLNRTPKAEPQAELVEPIDVVTEKAAEIEALPPSPKKPIEIKHKDDVVHEEELDENLDEDDDEEDEAEEETQLSPEDVEKITQVASLSEADLNKEIESLRTRIEAEDLFAKLEEGELKGQDEANAKQMLERFALLGLEGTRRKFMNDEPELRDAVYAHRESLKEIRELLSDE